MARDRELVRQIMRSVRSEGGRADRALGSTLWRMGLRYRRRSKLVGNPDIVFPADKVAVFVDGDFWHGRFLDRHIVRGDFHRNADYWIAKLRRTVGRDKLVTSDLQSQGWPVVRVWESDVLKDVPAVSTEIAGLILRRREARQPPVDNGDSGRRVTDS